MFWSVGEKTVMHEENVKLHTERTRYEPSLSYCEKEKGGNHYSHLAATLHVV